MQDYLLPLYSLEIENPEQVAATQSSFPIKITPLYTFGQTVEGDADITISQNQWWWWRPSRPAILYTRSVHIKSGSETIDVRIKEDLGLSNADSQTYYLTISVKFTSSLTQAVAEDSSSITIVPFAYELVITGDPFFKKDTIYTAKLSLRKFDGRSVSVSLIFALTIEADQSFYRDQLEQLFRFLFTFTATVLSLITYGTVQTRTYN